MYQHKECQHSDGEVPFGLITQMKWYLISMCFVLSWNTIFFVILIQLWLSQRISVASISTSNSPANIFRSHTTSLHVEYATMYSAYAVLSEIHICFLLNQEIMHDPILKQHHDVIFLSLAILPQSESVYPCNLISPLDSYMGQ